MARTIRISAEDHARISAAVALAEAKSDGEISTMAARQSDSYAEWAVLLAALVAFLVPALVAIDSRGFNDLLVEITGAWHVDYSFGALAAATVALQLAVFLLVWLVLLWMPLRLMLTPSVLKRQRLHEAAIKAFSLSDTGMAWRDIEVQRSDDGACHLALHGRAAEAAERLGVTHIALSLSHDGDYAGAVVTALCGPQAAPDSSPPTSSPQESR